MEMSKKFEEIRNFSSSQTFIDKIQNNNDEIDRNPMFMLTFYSKWENIHKL